MLCRRQHSRIHGGLQSLDWLLKMHKVISWIILFCRLDWLKAEVRLISPLYRKISASNKIFLLFECRILQKPGQVWFLSIFGCLRWGMWSAFENWRNLMKPLTLTRPAAWYSCYVTKPSKQVNLVMHSRSQYALLLWFYEEAVEPWWPLCGWSFAVVI